MKISLDLHGVITDMPEALSKMTEVLIRGGAEVHIITGSPTDKAIEELSEIGFQKDIHYTHVIGVNNFLCKKGKEPLGDELDRYGNPLFSEIDWDTAKAQYCRENEIDLHLDDSDIYDKYFTTPYARIYTKNNHGKN